MRQPNPAHVITRCMKQFAASSTVRCKALYFSSLIQRSPFEGVSRLCARGAAAPPSAHRRVMHVSLHVGGVEQQALQHNARAGAQRARGTSTMDACHECLQRRRPIVEKGYREPRTANQFVTVNERIEQTNTQSDVFKRGSSAPHLHMAPDLRAAASQTRWTGLLASRWQRSSDILLLSNTALSLHRIAVLSPSE